MGISWFDLSIVMLLVSLAAILTVQSLIYLSRRDAQEILRNRQAMCRPHQWVRRESKGLVCRLCGKIPG